MGQILASKVGTCGAPLRGWLRNVSKYVGYGLGLMTDYPPRTGGEDGAPVTLGPDELRELWGAIDRHFELPAGSDLIDSKRTIDVTVWKSKRNRTLVVSDIEELLKPGEVSGLLDDIEFSRGIEFKQPGKAKSEARALRLKLWAEMVPRIWITGDADWAAALSKDLEKLFDAYPSHAREKQSLVVAGIALAFFAYFVRVTTSPISEWAGVAVSLLFASFAALFAFIATRSFFPRCRVFADRATAKEPPLYKYAGALAFGVAVSVIAWALVTYYL